MTTTNKMKKETTATYKFNKHTQNVFIKKENIQPMPKNIMSKSYMQQTLHTTNGIMMINVKALPHKQKKRCNNNKIKCERNKKNRNEREREGR